MKNTAIIFCTSVAITIAVFAYFVFQKTDNQPKAHSAVLIQLKDDKGYGSGFHIGDGYIVTAEHNVTNHEKTEPKVKDEFNRVYPTEVLWATPKYDVALLRVSNYKNLAASPLICTTPEVGEHIRVTGNPLGYRDITHEGTVSSKARSGEDFWDKVFMADIAVLFGMSGAGALNEDNEVVGMAVGVRSAPMGYNQSWTTMSYFVPASTICKLLAR